MVPPELTLAFATLVDALVEFDLVVQEIKAEFHDITRPIVGHRQSPDAGLGRIGSKSGDELNWRVLP